MKIGDRVRALMITNIRKAAGLSQPVIGKLHTNEERVLLEGPRDVDTLHWWRVDGGWVAEATPNQTRLLEVILPSTPGEKAIAFVLKWEGGLSLVATDPGNWTSGKIGIGVLKGTKYGISAASYPNLDIRNLTIEQAQTIYFRTYWPVAVSYDWPLSLAVMDFAVNAGQGRAREALAAVGPHFLSYMGWRITWYTGLSSFPTFGRGWLRRCADLLVEAEKPT